MSRFGLDMALDTLGIIRGIIAKCNYTLYKNSAGEDVEVDFVDDGGVFVPATGPLHFRSDSLADTLSGDINLDFTKDDDFHFENFWVEIGAVQPYYFEMYNSADASQYIRGIRGSGESWVIIISNGSSTVISTFASSVILGQLQTLGFSMSGPIGAKIFNSTVDGVGSADPETTDMTGVTLDKIVFGKLNALENTPSINLYCIESMQLGLINVVGRMWGQGDANANKFTGTATTENPSGVTLNLTDNDPVGAVFPNTIGSYNATTGAYLVSDNPCSGNDLLLDDNSIALLDDDGEFLIGD